MTVERPKFEVPGKPEKEPKYIGVFNDLSQTDARLNVLSKEAKALDDEPEAKRLLNERENIAGARNALEKGDIGPVVELYHRFLSEKLKQLDPKQLSPKKIAALERKRPGSFACLVVDSGRHAAMLKELLLDKNLNPNAEAIKLMQEKANERKQAAAEKEKEAEAKFRREVTEYLKKFNELNIREDNVLRSETGTRRKVLEIMLHPNVRGGGYLKVETVRPGQAPKREALNFKQVVDAFEEGIISIEKAQ